MKKYKIVASGGTFDMFHKGHREFLRYQLSLSEKVLLGITSDNFITLKKHSVSPFAVRKKSVTSFLKKEGALDRVEILPINENAIPNAWKDAPIEAIVVTEQTRSGVQKLQKPSMQIIEAPLVVASDGSVISSTSIRKGVMSRDGVVYIDAKWLTTDLSLPVSLREELGKPLGKLYADAAPLIKTIHKNKKTVVTVGDSITMWCNDHEVSPVLSVIDLIIQRKKIPKGLGAHTFKGKEVFFYAKNPPGKITAELFSVIKTIFATDLLKQRVVLQIEGEEDLAVMPIVLAAPLGFTVLYGQPAKGAVVMEITEELKTNVYNLLRRFEIVI
jgi:cytidyltransferase-like protein